MANGSDNPFKNLYDEDGDNPFAEMYAPRRRGLLEGSLAVSKAVGRQPAPQGLPSAEERLTRDVPERRVERPDATAFDALPERPREPERMVERQESTATPGALPRVTEPRRSPELRRPGRFQAMLGEPTTEELQPREFDEGLGVVVPERTVEARESTRFVPEAARQFDEPGDLSQGFRTGLQAAATGTGETLEQVGVATGAEGLVRRGEEISEASRAAVEALGPAPRILEARSPQDLIDWAQYSVGQAAGSTLAPLIGGVAGGAVAGPTGAMAGALGPSYGLMLGEIRSELERTPDVDESMKNWVAPIVAIPAAALEAVLPGSIGRGFLKRTSAGLARRIASGLFRGARDEALTEMGQTFIQQATTAGLSEREALATWENVAELVEAGAAGAVGGAAIGSPGAALEGTAGQPRPRRSTVLGEGELPSVLELREQAPEHFSRIGELTDRAGAGEVDPDQAQRAIDRIYRAAVRGEPVPEVELGERDVTREPQVFEPEPEPEVSREAPEGRERVETPTGAVEVAPRVVAGRTFPGEDVYDPETGEFLGKVVPVDDGFSVMGGGISGRGVLPTRQEALNALAGVEGPAPPQEGPRPETEAEVQERVAAASQQGNLPENVYEVAPSELDREPERLQFKQDVDEEGVTSELQNVQQWDPNLAGVVLVWRDPADGRLKIVNGHHRHELAERLGVDRMLVREIQVETPGEARVVGALTNIAEGRGTAIDAAKLFRDENIGPEDLAERGVSIKGEKARLGMALSNLHQTIFQDVATQRLKVRRAAVIGEADLSHPQQLAVYEMVRDLEERGQRPTNAEIEELIRFARGAGETTETQETLFGAEEVTRSNALEKASLSAWVKRQLSRDRRLFGYLTRAGRAERIQETGAGEVDVDVSEDIASTSAQAEELYNRLSTRAGPISDALNRAARRVAEGEDQNAVRQELYEEITATIEELGGGRRAGEPVEGGPGAEPGVPTGGAVAALAPIPENSPILDVTRQEHYGIPQEELTERALDRLEELNALPRVQEARERAIPPGSDEDTLSLYPDGHPEREILRGEWLEDAIENNGFRSREEMVGEVGEYEVARQRQAYIILGPPASGKSTFANPVISELKARLIDADEFKWMMDEMQEGENASGVHRESADLMVPRLAEHAAQRGENVVIPAVGKTLTNGEDGLIEEIQKWADADYDVHIVINEIPELVAANRSHRRFEGSNRYVPYEYIIQKVDARPQANFQEVKDNPNVVSYQRYSNDVPYQTPPVLLEEGGRIEVRLANLLQQEFGGGVGRTRGRLESQRSDERAPAGGGEGVAALAPLEGVDQGRLERARAQGFRVDEPMYHGTKSAEEIEAFAPWVHVGSPVAATARLQYVSQQTGGYGQENDRVMPVFIREGEYLEARDGVGWRPDTVLSIARDAGVISEEEAQEVLERPYSEEELQERYAHDSRLLEASRGTSPTRFGNVMKARVGELLQSKGYRGLRYRNAVEDPGSFSYLVFNPSDVRSIHARFEPGRERSSDLLALSPQEDLFGGPVQGEEVQGELLPEEGGPQGISQAEERARAIVSSLQGKVERGAATRQERTQYNNARTVLRRGEGMDAEEVRARLEGQETEELDPMVGDLFNGPVGDNPSSPLLPGWSSEQGGTRALAPRTSELLPEDLSALERMDREEFLGNPEITSEGNASELSPHFFKSNIGREPEPWIQGLQIFRGEPTERGHVGFTVADDGQPIASYDGDVLVVDPEYRRRGIGSSLVVDFRSRHPEVSPADQRTRIAQGIQERAWEIIQAEISRRRGRGGTRALASRPSENLPESAPYATAETATTLPEGQDVPSTREIVEDMKEVLDLAIREGKLPRAFKRQALAVYKVVPEVARARDISDLEAIAHEAGHHLHKRFFGSTEDRLSDEHFIFMPAPVRADLERLGAGISDESMAEGWAEYWRRWFNNPQALQRQVPNLDSFVQDLVGKDVELENGLLMIREKIAQYRGASPVDRVGSHISVDEDPRTFSIKDAIARARYAVLDELDPLARVVEHLESGVKDTGTLDADAISLARLVNGVSGVAEHFLREGTLDFQTHTTRGASLESVLAPVREELGDFRKYIVSRRAQELHERDLDTGLRPEDVDAAVAELESRHGDTFVQAFDDLLQYQNETLEYLRDAGVISERAVSAMRELNQNYVPFYRVMDDQQGAVAGFSKRFGHLFNPVKRIKGSGRQVIDPLESIIKNTYVYSNLAARQQVSNALAELSQVDGAGKFIEELETPMVPQNVQLGEVRSDLEEIVGADIVSSLEERAEQEWQNTLEEMGLTEEEARDAGLEKWDPAEELMMFFRPGDYFQTQNMISVLDGDTRRWFQVHPELYESLEGLGREELGAAVRFMSKPARWLRAGATLAPEFQLRNPARDQIMAWIQSEHGYKPIVDLARGIFALVKKGDAYWQWKASGGSRAALLGLDRDSMQNNLRDLVDSGGVTGVLMRPMDALRALSALMEDGTRMGEFLRAREDFGTSKEGLQKAGLASREVTIDFAKHGAKTTALRHLSAFWNARLQGYDRLYQVAKDRPGEFLTKAFVGITLPSLLEWWVYRDDEEYWELPQWQRDLFWMIRIRGQWVRIPKPFELGLVFGTLPQRIMGEIYKDDPEGLDRFFEETMVKEAEGFVPFPNAALPLIENMVNYSFFLDRPIVPRGEEDLRPELQFGEHTSEVAQMLGRWAPGGGISPRKIDNVLYSWGGGLGRLAAQIADYPADVLQGEPPRPAQGLVGVPGLRGVLARTPGFSSESVERFYQTYTEARTADRSLRRLEEIRGSEPEQYRQELRDPEATQLRQILPDLRDTAAELSELRDQAHAIERHPTMDPQEKKERLDALGRQAMLLARSTIRRRVPDGTSPLP